MLLRSNVRRPSLLLSHQDLTFVVLSDEIEIMRSLAKPRKITITGSDGQIYSFLGKPKDDLRKDSRLMDFNAILNKLLKSDSDSRRRQLRTLACHQIICNVLISCARYPDIRSRIAE